MSFDSDYNEILLLLHLQEARLQQDYKIIRDILERMRRAYHQNIQTVEDTDDTRPENWTK